MIKIHSNVRAETRWVVVMEGNSCFPTCRSVGPRTCKHPAHSTFRQGCWEANSHEASSPVSPDDNQSDLAFNISRNLMPINFWTVIRGRVGTTWVLYVQIVHWVLPSSCIESQIASSTYMLNLSCNCLRLLYVFVLLLNRMIKALCQIRKIQATVNTRYWFCVLRQIFLNLFLSQFANAV